MFLHVPIKNQELKKLSSKGKVLCNAVRYISDIVRKSSTHMNALGADTYTNTLSESSFRCEVFIVLSYIYVHT